MAPIDRSCSNATSQPNMYIEKFNIPRLRLCITDVAASKKILGKIFNFPGSARLPIPDHRLNQEILDFSMWN